MAVLPISKQLILRLDGYTSVGAPGGVNDNAGMNLSPKHVLACLLVCFAAGEVTAQTTTPEVPKSQMLTVPAQAASMAPRLTAGANGQGILTWLERSDAGHRFRFAVFDGTKFDRTGTIHAGEGFFANWADTPGLIVAPDGTWFAHWLQRSGAGTYAYDIMAVTSSDQGRSWSAPFSPHDDQTPTEHGFASYFATNSGQTGMVWLDGRMTRPDAADHSGDAHHAMGDGAMTLRSALVGSNGTVTDSSLIDDRVCDCCSTAAGLTDEGVVVIYRDRSETEIRDIKLVRRTPTGWTEPVAVHEDGWKIGGCPVNGPALLVRGQTVIVAWFTMADDTPRVRIARSEDGGRHFAAPRDLDTDTALGRVDLAWTGDGYALSWLTESQSGQDGEGLMRLARFESSGKLISTMDLLPIRNDRSSGFPRLLDLGEDRLLVSWTGQSAETGESQIRAAVLENRNREDETQ